MLNNPRRYWSDLKRKLNTEGVEFDTFRKESGLKSFNLTPRKWIEATNAIGNLKDSTPLSDFFKRINFRKGRVSATSATARKLSVIIWNMVVKCVPYNNPEGYLFLDQKRRLGIVKRIRKQINRYGLSTEDLNLVTD